MTLRLTVGSLAVLLALFAFLPGSGDSTGLPPGVSSEDCYRHTSEDTEWINVFTCIRHEPSMLAMVWERQPGAETYRVSGDVNYLGRRRCGDGPSPPPGFRDQFSSLLNAKQTWFPLPAPDDDPGTYFLKSYEFQVEALDPDGMRLALGGRYVIGEEQPCPEEIPG